MNRDRSLDAFATVLALVTVGVVAATFERGALEFELRTSPGVTGDRGLESVGPDLAVQCPAVLRSWSVIAPLIGIVIAIGVLTRRGSRSPTQHLLATGAVAVVLIAVCPVPIPELPVGVGGRSIPITWRQFLVAVLALGLVAQVVAGVWLWNQLRGDRRRPGSRSAVDPDEPDLSEIAAAAGTVADAIEAPAATENGVYRAWREMTALLDVPDPQSSTPAEFAQAAVDAGMDPEHVDQLTTLFRDVRYGDKDASEREERAVEVLRRIEREYGGVGE